MKINQKVAFTVAGIFAVSVIASVAVQRLAIMPSFLHLEQQSARDNTQRVVKAIQREVDQIGPSVGDWARWDATYKYVKGEAPEYASENLELDSTLPALKMHFMAIYDVDGKLVWATAVDLVSGERLKLGALTEDGLPSGHSLLTHEGLLAETKGIVQTAHAPLMVSSMPILTSTQQGPAAGTFMMGRFLNANAKKQISEQTRLSFELVPIDGSVAVNDAPPRAEQGLAGPLQLEDQGARWQGVSQLYDLTGSPVLELQVYTGRDITAHGADAVNVAFWSLAATGFVAMLVLWVVLRRVLLDPIASLAAHAQRVGSEDKLDLRLDLQRSDEIGTLANNIDDMVAQLADSRRQLVDKSFHSGVAEMASGVLHNIGNALTPLTVKLAGLRRDLQRAPVAEVEQAMSELQGPVSSAERRDDLTQFVQLASTDLAKLVRQSQAGIDVAAVQVNNIQEILADQERFSRAEQVVESVDLGDTVATAFEGLSPTLKSALSLQIAPEIGGLGAVAGSRIALHQVVTNLLINAAESVASTQTGEGGIAVTAVLAERQGEPYMHVCFDDDGAGIEPQHLEHIFERGFSTKQSEGRGYGLHWTANMLQLLGGSISAESRGSDGRGARMHVYLPLAEAAPMQASSVAGA